MTSTETREDRLVSMGEAAAMLGCSTSTLRRLDVNEIFVPDFRTPGGHRRYKESRVLGYREQLHEMDLDGRD